MGRRGWLSGHAALRANIRAPDLTPSLTMSELSPILGDGLKDQAAAVWD
jgi:hypothetical protein